MMKIGDMVQNERGWQGRVEQITQSKRFGWQVLVEYASRRNWESRSSLYVVVARSDGRKDE